jgi:hypothetical protein
MGLSNEERIQRVLNALVVMRHEVDSPNNQKWDDRDRGLQSHLDALGQSLEQLTGTLIQQTDTADTYWLFGEPNNGFRGLTMQYFRAETKDFGQACMDAFYEEHDDGDLSLNQFASRLGFGVHYNMLNLATWWDLWCYIPALLYGMNRYKDALFSKEFHQEVNRLISLMMQFRRDLVDGKYQEEQVLLLKYKIYVDDKFKDEKIPWAARCKKLRAMTQDELEGEIDRREREQWKSRQEYKEKESKEKGIDPVHGAVDMTINGHVEEVIELLCEANVYQYCKRSEILRALELYDGSVEAAAELLQAFAAKKELHAKRYGKENVKICKHCKFVVLDQRNKSGLCAECLAVEKRYQKKNKKG